MSMKFRAALNVAAVATLVGLGFAANLLAVSPVAAASSALAAGSPATVNPAVPGQAAPIDEATLKHKLEERLQAKIDSIARTPYAGLVEVRSGSQVVYADSSGDFLFVGDVIDLRSHENITSKRVSELTEASQPKVKFADLPLNSAIKIVHGNGARTLVAFEDPNCVFCKRLEKSLVSLNDVTIYVFLYPVLGDDSVTKAKAIWCASNPAQAWTQWMTTGTLVSSKGNCKNPIDANVALGEKLHVDGTPTTFFASGKRAPGAISAEDLERLLASR